MVAKLIPAIMKKFAALLPAVLLGLSTLAGAFDDDPGSFSDRPWMGGRTERKDRPEPNAPLYFRPTQRYYGSGYTISYRYIPVFRSDSSYSVPFNGATNFRTEVFHIATSDIPSWGTNPPRLTVKDPKSAAPRTAVTSIVRKKTTPRTGGKVEEPDSPLPNPGTTETPAPATGSPAPVPPPTEPRAKP